MKQHHFSKTLTLVVQPLTLSEFSMASVNSQAWCCNLTDFECSRVTPWIAWANSHMWDFARNSDFVSSLKWLLQNFLKICQQRKLSMQSVFELVFKILLRHILRFIPISGRVDRASATETVGSTSILGPVKPKTIKIAIPSLTFSNKRDNVKPLPCVVDKRRAWLEDRKVFSLSPGQGSLLNTHLIRITVPAKFLKEALIRYYSPIPFSASVERLFSIGKDVLRK